MTAKKLLRVLAGEAVWPPPVWLMRQAGRYLPEYRALREESDGFIARCTNPDLATEITLQPIRRYGMDAAILFSDILMLPWAMGHGLDFVEGEGPVLPKLRDAAALNRLSLDRVPEMTAPIIETVRRVRATLPESCALIGFAGSPFTVACYMVEGGGSRDFAATRLLSYAEPVLFDRLIDLLVEATIGYLSAQVAAGAETVMLFDTWAGLLPPAEFARHVVEPTKRIVAAIKRLHPGLPVIGFPRLAGTQLGAYAGQTGVDAVGLDTAADPVVAASLVPAHIALQGNLDPLAVVAGGEALEQQATAIATAFRGRPHIFNLGHGILPQTPTENVAALIERLRSLP